MKMGILKTSVNLVIIARVCCRLVVRVITEYRCLENKDGVRERVREGEEFGERRIRASRRSTKHGYIVSIAAVNSALATGYSQCRTLQHAGRK